MTHDYLCLIVLKILRDNPGIESHKLFQLVAIDPDVLNARQNDGLREQDILDAFTTLIDGNYIDGKYVLDTSDGPAYAIDGITAEGLALLS